MARSSVMVGLCCSRLYDRLTIIVLSILLSCFICVQIKTVAVEERDHTEQKSYRQIREEIRIEVLEEVKASLLDSLPKK